MTKCLICEKDVCACGYRRGSLGIWRADLQQYQIIFYGDDAIEREAEYLKGEGNCSTK